MLRKGFETLAGAARLEVADKARGVLDTRRLHDLKYGAFRAWCPLCSGGRCLLYAYRPMICRLHGIGWAMTLPDGRVERGPGCAAFEAASRGRAVALDRTPLYTEMAVMEKKLRVMLSFSGRINASVAEILVRFSSSLEEP
jgi:hypothetical protein